MSWLTLCTLMCMPDRFHLSRLADSAGLPPAMVLAIAYVETRNNVHPAVRGAHGERGRMQIKPSTAAERCPGLDIDTYKGNIQCSLRILSEDVRAFGPVAAIQRYNGNGEASVANAERVLALAGRWLLERRNI